MLDLASPKKASGSVGVLAYVKYILIFGDINERGPCLSEIKIKHWKMIN